MPIYQVMKGRLMQSLLYVQAASAQEAEVIAIEHPPEKEVAYGDIMVEIIWCWEDDDLDAPTPVN